MALRLGDQKNKRYVKITPTPVNRHGSRVVQSDGVWFGFVLFGTVFVFNYALAFCVESVSNTPTKSD